MATISFKGKSIIQNHHLAVKYHQLVPVKDKSLTDKVSLNDNLIIHGDNLKALKALLPSYAGKVKCIYIDPPYNTGNENWRYNDNVNSPMMQEWLGKVVDKEDLTRHDKWLCMMMPRLKLLREFLAEDGFIFVSIDDNELHRLKMLLDEIFSEDNFRNTFVVRRYDKNINRQFIEGGLFSLNVGFESVLLYSKNSDAKLSPVYRESSEDRQTNGYWKGFWNDADRPTMRYDLLGVIPEYGQWKWKKEVAFEAVENYREYVVNHSAKISLEDYWSKTGKSKKFIRRTENGKGVNLGVEHWIPPTAEVLRNSNWSDLFASKSIKSLGIDFDNPKDYELIKEFLKLSTTDDIDAIILDSFAGSGPTGHAVLSLNKEDGGNRKFVLVECEDYTDNITAERIRRVIKGAPESKDAKLKNGLGGSFSYFELGNPIEMESILDGKSLPSYLDLARYVFYTATGEEFLPDKVDEYKGFIGESKEYEVYLFYKPDIEYLKSTALTLELVKKLGASKGKKKLVFAPAKYLDLNDTELLTKHGLKDVEYCQLPFEIYRLKD